MLSNSNLFGNLHPVVHVLIDKAAAPSIASSQLMFTPLCVILHPKTVAPSYVLQSISTVSAYTNVPTVSVNLAVLPNGLFEPSVEESKSPLLYLLLNLHHLLFYKKLFAQS